MQDMRLPEALWRVSWGKIQSGAHKAPLASYVRSMGAFTKSGAGFLLWGPNGRGKSAIAALLMMEARRQGHTGLWMPVASLKDAAFNDVRYDSSTRLIQRARDVMVLVLDDLGKGVQDSKGAGARLLDELIRDRASHFRVTHITTNMSPIQKAGFSQIEEELKASTLHAMRDRIVNLLIDGEDLRMDGRRAILSKL